MKKLALVLILVLLVTLAACAAQAQEAQDMTQQSEILYNGKKLDWKKLADGNLNSVWKSRENTRQTLTFQMPEGQAGGGVYLTFKATLPAGVKWTAEYQDEQGSWQVCASGELSYLNTFVPVEGSQFRVVFEKDRKFALSIRELRLFSQGETPADVQKWQSPDRTQALVVLAGCGQQKLPASLWEKETPEQTAVAVMAQTKDLQTLELLAELWQQGVVNYPAQGTFKATANTKAAKVTSQWGQKKMNTFLAGVYRDYRPQRVYAPAADSIGADGAAAIAAQQSITLAGTIEWDLNSGKDHGIHIPDELYALSGETITFSQAWAGQELMAEMMQAELGQIQRADAGSIQTPQRDEEGYLTEGEFTFADETKGVWMYLSDDLQVTIVRCFEAKTPLTWFEADVKMRGDEKWENVFHEKGRRWAKQPDAIARDNRLIFALTTDNYNIRVDSEQRSGVIIRNGEFIHDEKGKTPKNSFPPLDTLMLDETGAFSVYGGVELRAQDYLTMGAQQVYSFGPYLIRDGEFRVLKTAYDKAREPRLAIGMIEPGHYSVVMMEGRIKGRSRGSDLMTLGRLLYLKGCTEAFNLDGGHSAVICFMGEQVNKIGSLVHSGYGKPRNTTEMLGVGHYE